MFYKVQKIFLGTKNSRKGKRKQRKKGWLK